MTPKTQRYRIAKEGNHWEISRAAGSRPLVQFPTYEIAREFYLQRHAERIEIGWETIDRWADQLDEGEHFPIVGASLRMNIQHALTCHLTPHQWRVLRDLQWELLLQQFFPEINPADVPTPREKTS